MPNKSVQFAEYSQSYSCASKFESEDEENATRWYSPLGLRRMRSNASRIARSFLNPGAPMNGDEEHQELTPEEMNTAHGIETLIRRDIFLTSMRERVDHFNAIMDEQTRQERLQYQDAKALAMISEVYSRKACERARARGLKHFVERE